MRELIEYTRKYILLLKVKSDNKTMYVDEHQMPDGGVAS